MAVDLKKSLRDDAYGYVVFCPKVDCYGGVAVEAILDAIEAAKFSGRCEYYGGHHLFGDEYLVGIAFRFLGSTRKKPKPTLEWWATFVDRVEASCKHTQQGMETTVPVVSILIGWA